MKTSATIITLVLLLASLKATAFAGLGGNDLKHYGPVDERYNLTPINGNLSGITYNSDTHTYFLIQNYGNIYEYDRRFTRPLRIITLLNLRDPDIEDLVYLGKNRFALVSETNHVLIFMIPNNTTSIDLNSARQDVLDLTLPPPKKTNKGLEGLCYSPSALGRGTFYAIQQDKPRKIYTFNWPARDVDTTSPQAMGVEELFNVEAVLGRRMGDLNGCVYDRSTGHIFLLSHESSRVMEISRSGRIVQTLDVPAYGPQYEGITFGADQELILVSEPNTLIVMKKR